VTAPPSSEPEIAPFPLPTPKKLAYNQICSGSDAPFARYSPLNYTVTLKLGFGSLKVIDSCAIVLADPENRTIEPNITSIGKPVAKLWPFLYIQDGRQPPSWILSNRK